MRFFTICGFLACFASACTVQTGPVGDDDGGDDDGGQPSGYGFTVSNVDVGSLDFDNVGDLTVSDDKTWQTDLGGLLGSTNSGAYNYQVVPQPGGLSLGVFTVNSLTVTPGAVIHVRGANALVIVALDTIEIDGTLMGNSQMEGGWIGPGASEDDSDGNIAGLGDGGGAAGSGGTSAGGGGFCGTGGAGAALDVAAADGGPSNGAMALAPLVAGSAGGSAFGTGGAGGGAIQLVAASSIQIGGTIHVGGKGGGTAGVFNGDNSQQAGAGGSGGAVLLEAHAIGVTGTIAANGGAGGQGDDGGYGGDATATAAAASGDDGTHGSAGGDGAAASAIDGQDGSVATAATSGGGGGAAGRIRFNTGSGSADVASATLSPLPSTACVTQGVVAP